ncbi:MAG: glycosyltransferase [Bacteroidota bacterium]
MRQIKNINIIKDPKYTVLIAPLDWGLGHATRCIPLIEKLLIVGFKVIIAAEGDQKILLQSAFPELEFVHLSGYKLKYGTTRLRTILKIIFQIPKILTAINRENKWLRNFIKSKHLDVVIADNRFGMHNKKIISIFITHQLLIKTSAGKFTDTLVQKINYHFINQFNYCWIPDAAGEINLAGELSHPATKPKNKILYTGVLSGINKENITVTNKLLIILSGPEPQRSIIEKILLEQLKNYTHPVILVRGLPSANEIISAGEGITIYNFLSGLQLQQVINMSEIIISRSGYSTIMDLLPLGKKCIFIPTPGQAEQEYLANRMAFNNYAVIGYQNNFSLLPMIQKAENLQIPDLSALKMPGNAIEIIAALITQLDTQE